MLSQHCWAFATAVLVGIFAVLPTVLAPLIIDGAYRSISYMPMDDEEIYASKIREITEGYGMVGHPYLWEYKKASNPVPPINEWLYAVPAFVFGIAAVVLASKFVLPALIFFFAYLALRRLIDDEKLAIAGGLLVFLSVELVDYGYLFQLVHGAWPRPLLWTRLVNPAVGAVEVFAFVYLVILTIEKKWRFAPYVAGLILALSVGYYFSFGISVSLLGTLILIYALRRDVATVFDLIKAGASAIVLTLPYWYLVISAVGTPEAAARSGMFFTHTPVVNKLLFAATFFALILFLYIRARTPLKIEQDRMLWIMGAASLSAGWIAFNEQILTGRDIWHHHFVQYATPLATFALVLMLGSAFRSQSRIWAWGTRLVIAALLAFLAFSTLSLIPRLDAYERLQSYGTLAQWLDREAPKDCVVLVYEEAEAVARYIPAYSHCNVYITTFTFSGVPMDRIEHNFFLRMQLMGVTPAMAETYLRTHEGAVRGTFFENWNQGLMNADPEWFEALVPQLAEKYRRFESEDLAGNILKYRVDYIAADGPLPSDILGQLPHAKERAVVENWHIYAF